MLRTSRIQVVDEVQIEVQVCVGEVKFNRIWNGPKKQCKLRCMRNCEEIQCPEMYQRWRT